MDRGPVHDFYPSSCVLLTRRGFLSLGATALGVAALARPSRVFGAKQTREWDDVAMRGLIDRYAVAKEDPWRIAHGVRGVGKEFMVGSGISGVHYILSTFPAEEVVSSTPTLYFPPDVEPHTNLYLNNFLEAGVPRSYAFEARGRHYTLEDLIAGAKARFDLAKVHPNDIAWSLVSFTTATSPLSGRWVNAWRQPVEVGAFVQRAFQVAEEATQSVRATWMQNKPLAVKSAIDSFTCGGTHLIYSLVVAVRNGYRVENIARRLRDQLGMLIYRMWAEIDLIDRFFAVAPGGSEGPNRWASLDAKWKFLGHAFEVYHYALSSQLLRPTAAEAKVVERARQVLQHLSKEVEEVDLGAVRRHDEDLFRQFVGDTCHAYRGVHLA